MQKMNINRHNYESFFLLYTDNELDTAGRKAVEDFVAQNPDLARELALLQQSVFPPDEQVVFAGKDSLFKSEAEGIHAGNYETFFISYADDELNNDQKRMVESFVYRHPQYQEELELLQAVRVEPDSSVGFPDKQSLYRREERDDKVVPFPWWRLAAAAMVLLALGLWWITREKPPAEPSIARQPSKQAPATQPGKTGPGAQPGNTAPGLATPGMSIAGTNPAATDKKQDSEAVPRPAPQRSATADRTPPAPVLAVNKAGKARPAAATPGTDQLPGTPVTSPQTDAVARLATLPDRPHDAASNNIRVNAKPGLIAQAVTFNHPDDNLITDAIDDDSDHSNNDRIAIMNTSVKKTALRGFLRKASRVIARKAGSGDENDDNQRHILIGSFAIAVK
jgi:anti-sigma factor RsiW